jgi:N-acetylneuraminate synthase
VGLQFPPYYIADIAANHNGSLERAYKLITLAKQAGAHAAKFQNFKARKIVSEYGFNAIGCLSHQAHWRRSVIQTYADATVPDDWSRLLKQKCDEIGIEYMTSPYDVESVDLADKYVNAFKIGSGDITYTQILSHIASKGKPVLLATGASNMDEVRKAVRFFAPEKLALMQCNTNYTCLDSNLSYINLNVLKTYALEFPHLVLGISDHTQSSAIIAAAVAFGARVIEQHLTDNTDLDGPDHKFSMLPGTFAEMVHSCDEVFRALGDGIKRVEDNERETAAIQRRGLYATKKIKSGEILTASDIAALRPALSSGFAADETESLIGKIANYDIEEGAAIMKSAIAAMIPYS